jgi:hypothetical protein
VIATADKRSIGVWAMAAAALIVAVAPAGAQGGPPFRTDDPDTPGQS